MNKTKEMTAETHTETNHHTHVDVDIGRNGVQMLIETPSGDSKKYHGTNTYEVNEREENLNLGQPFNGLQKTTKDSLATEDRQNSGAQERSKKGNSSAETRPSNTDFIILATINSVVIALVALEIYNYLLHPKISLINRMTDAISRRRR